MPLHLAWKSPSPLRPAGIIPGERFRLLRTRMNRPARNNLPLSIGTRVFYMEEPGCITALNIAAIGRWPAHLYPFIVQLDCGLTLRCHALDLDVDTSSSARRDGCDTACADTECADKPQTHADSQNHSNNVFRPSKDVKPEHGVHPASGARQPLGTTGKPESTMLF